MFCAYTVAEKHMIYVLTKYDIIKLCKTGQHTDRFIKEISKIYLYIHVLVCYYISIFHLA